MRIIGNAVLLSVVSLTFPGSSLEQPRLTRLVQEDIRQPEGATRASATSSVTGTIRSVDVRGRTVDVIAGVGHALRSVWMLVSPECYVSVAGETGRLDDLRRGDVIRVEYGEEVEGLVAVRIEAVRDASQGGRR